MVRRSKQSAGPLFSIPLVDFFLSKKMYCVNVSESGDFNARVNHDLFQSATDDWSSKLKNQTCGAVVAKHCL